MRKKSKFDIRRQHRATDFKRDDTEKELVAGILKSTTILEEVNSKFDSDWITSDRLKRIYDMAVDLYMSTNQLMDTRSFKNMLQVPNERQKVYHAMWRKLRRLKSKVSAPSTLTAAKRLGKLHQARNMQIGLQEIVQHLDTAASGNLDLIDRASAAVTEMNEHVQASVSSRVAVAEPVSAYQDWKREYRKIQKDPSAAIGVPTGVGVLDQYMIGLRNGELGVVCGPSGSGKSVAIMEFAINAWRFTGKDVIIVTIEMPKEQMLNRIYCHMAGVDYEKFRKYTLTSKDWKRLDHAVANMAKYENKIHVIDMPEGCSVLKARNEVKKYIKNDNVSLIVVDYLNIMCGPSGKIDFSWQNQLEIAVQMKLEFARALKLPVWTACQTDGENDFGFSKHIKDQLDVAGVLELTDATATDGRVFWNWIKTRDFKGKTVVLETALNYMRITPLPADLEKKNKGMKRLKNKKKKVKV